MSAPAAIDKPDHTLDVDEQLAFERPIRARLNSDEAACAEFERNRIARDSRASPNKIPFQGCTTGGVELIVFGVRSANNPAAVTERLNAIRGAMASVGFTSIDRAQLVARLDSLNAEHSHYRRDAPPWSIEASEAVVSAETGVPLGLEHVRPAAADAKPEQQALRTIDAPPVAPADADASAPAAPPAPAWPELARRNVEWLFRTFKGTQHVAAIHPDGADGPHFLTFTEKTAEKAITLIAKYGRTHGLYYQANEVRPDLGPNRATKTDIVKIRAVTVDVDPDKEAMKQPGGLDRERERIRAEGRERESNPHTCPSYTVSSGRGEQRVYVLAEPVDARENQDRAEDLTRGVLRDAGTDESTTDITRLMRLPHGLNHPNAEKRKYGHTKSVPTALVYQSDTRWTLDELEARYTPVPKAKKASGGAANVVLDMDAIEAVETEEDWPPGLRKKLDEQCEKNPALAALLAGIFPPDANDKTGSGFAYWVAKYLRPTAQFSPTEFGQILRASKHSSEPDKMDARYLGRTWNKARAAAEEDFEAVEGADRIAQEDRARAVSDTGPDASLWRAPVNLWDDETAPTEFPENIVPSIVARFAFDQARRLGVVAGAIAAPVVVAFGSLVPSTIKIHLLQNSDSWAVRSILWAALVGPPGSKKSPALGKAVTPARIVEADWRKQYAKEKEAYDSAYPPQEPRKRKRRAGTKPVEQSPPAESSQTADNLFDSVSSIPKDPPAIRQKIVNDTTTEALTDVLAANPSGVLCAADELAGWLAGMDAYKARAGKDRAIWLQAKDGDAYTVNRKGSGVTHIKHNAVSLVGTIQDDKLANIADSLTDDGLLQRIALVAITQTGDGEDIPDDVDLNESVARTALHLADLDAADYRLSPGGAEELKAVHRFKHSEINRIDIPPALRQWIDKTPNEFGRYCLAFHLIEWACGLAPALGEPPDTLVPRETAARARRYIQEFLYPHARYVYGTIMARGIGDEHARWIAGFLLAYKRDSIRRRDISRAYKALRDSKHRGVLLSAMATLEAADWVRVTTPAQEWKVNPKVHDMFAERAVAERERRMAVRAKIAEDGASRASEKGAAA